MNKVVLVFLVAFLFFVVGFYLPSSKPSVSTSTSSLGSQSFSSWKEFTSRSGLFTVSMPTEPQYAKDVSVTADGVNKVRYDMYASEKLDGTLFLINVITYSQKNAFVDAEDALDRSLEDIVKSHLENRLIASKKGEYKGYPSLSFQLENGEYHSEGRIINQGERIFVLTYTANKPDFSLEESEHFFDSFAIKNGKDQQSPLKKK